jgi:hypothetical protein
MDAYEVRDTSVQAWGMVGHSLHNPKQPHSGLLETGAVWAWARVRCAVSMAMHSLVFMYSRYTKTECGAGVM